MLTVSSEKFPTEVDEIIDSEALLDIKITKHRKKKSLNANAYAWVLMQKIAEKTNSDKWSVYFAMSAKVFKKFYPYYSQRECSGTNERTIQDLY